MIEVHPYFEEIAHSGGFYSEALMKRIAEEGSVRHLEEVPEQVRRVFATAHDIPPEWHIRLQAAFQRHTDNAVSKTVNFPNHSTMEDVEKVYLLAFRSGCKGVTIYRDGSREEQVLNVGHKKKEQPRDPATGIAVTRPARPRLLQGETERMETGCGKLFVIMNDDELGPREVFANMGKAGGCAASSSAGSSAWPLRRAPRLQRSWSSSRASAATSRTALGPTRSPPAPTPWARPWSAATCRAARPSGLPSLSWRSRRSLRALAQIAVESSSTKAAVSCAGCAATPNVVDRRRFAFGQPFVGLTDSTLSGASRRPD